METASDNSPQFQAALNRVFEELQELHAENCLQKILIQHAVLLLARWTDEPQKVFEEIRDSSRANLADNLVFEDGDPTINESVRQTALRKHRQMFEEISRALGFRRGTQIQ